MELSRLFNELIWTSIFVFAGFLGKLVILSLCPLVLSCVVFSHIWQLSWTKSYLFNSPYKDYIHAKD